MTAFADVLAGYALADLSDPRALPWLLLASGCLYAGGVVLNDYFDRDLDRIERPERPIPSGRVQPGRAAAVGGILLVAGVVSAMQANDAAWLLAGTIAACVLLYDVWGKRHAAFGPVNMGTCRALNLLLGVAAAPSLLEERWPVALIPLAYIAAVTALSRGEVHGGQRGAATFALISLTAALSGLAWLVVESGQEWIAVVVLAVLGWRVFPPFLAAWHTLEPGRIRGAVKRGVLSLVLVNAVIGTVYAGPVYGAMILATGLVANALARVFPVT